MPTPVAPELRRARRGVTLLFFLNAVAFMSVVPRYPEIKRALELGDTAWGAVLAVGPLGGLAAALFTARLMRRHSSALVASLSQAISIVAINLLVNAPVWWVFAAGIFVVLVFDALCDIAMNSHGLRVQRAYGRSILNSFHAWWSVGAVTGGLLGSAFAQAGVALWLQGLVTTTVFMAASLYARSLLLPGPDSDIEDVTAPAGSVARIPGPLLMRLLALGALGAAAGLIEDTGASWSAVYIDRAFEVTPFVVGMGFVALQGAQTIGRFTGDLLVDRVGHRWAVAQGVIVAALGMGGALAFPTASTTIAGFACAGWGMATVIPAAMHTADELPGLQAGTGLTIVTWMMRIGFLSGPPLVGLLADVFALRWALLVVPALALVMLALTPALAPARRAS